MGVCQNYDPFLGTLNIRRRIIRGIQNGTIILTTTHVVIGLGFDLLVSALAREKRQGTPSTMPPTHGPSMRP